MADYSHVRDTRPSDKSLQESMPDLARGASPDQIRGRDCIYFLSVRRYGYRWVTVFQR